MEANGKQPEQPIDLKDIRAQRRLVESKIELERLKQSRAMLEGLFDFGDPDGIPGSDTLLRARFVDPDGTTWLPLSSAGDRRHGQQWPIWNTEAQLAILRQSSRILCACNGFAQSLIRNLTNYIVGPGFTYKVATKEGTPDADPDKAGMQTGPDLKSLVAKSQDVVDRFLECNRWNVQAPLDDSNVVADSREQEIVRRIVRDGEAIPRFFPVDRDLYVRFVEPEQITQPPGHTAKEGWSYGIQHRMEPFEDVESRVSYHISYQDPTTAPKDRQMGDVVPADEILHILAPGTDATIKRGTPMISYGVAESLERAAKLERNISIGAAIRAATAEIWQSNGTQQQVSALAGNLQERTRTNPRSGQTERMERIGPGAIRRIPAGQQLVAQPADNTASYLQALQADLRVVAAAFSLPEFMVSADTSGGNYSNLESASAPTVKMGDTLQKRVISACLAAVWKALRHAVSCGVLDERALAVIKVQVDGPAVLHRNELEKAQKDDIQIRNKIKSPQTAMMEDGLDPETEMGNIEAFEERMGQQGGGLPMPGDQPPGGGGPDLGGGPSPFGESVIEALLEARLLEAGFSGTITDKAGHKRMYSNGKQVAGTHPLAGTGKKPAGGDGASLMSGGLARVKATAGDMKAAAAGMGEAAWAKLPPKAQTSIATAYAGGKWLLHKLETPFRKGKEIAVQAAKERGLDDAYADRVGKILGFADLAAAWTVNFPVVTAATGNPLLGKASSWVPVASMAYIAYSTARNPIATIRAAGKVLSGQTASAHEGTEDLDVAGELLQRISERGDWYEALVIAAFDITHDLPQAIERADAAFDAQPDVDLEEDDMGNDPPVDDLAFGATGGGETFAASSGAVTEAEESEFLEAGFTGTVTDRRGRKLHYVNGKRVAGSAYEKGGHKGDHRDLSNPAATPAKKPAAKPKGKQPAAKKSASKGWSGEETGSAATGWKEPLADRLQRIQDVEKGTGIGYTDRVVNQMLGKRYSTIPGESNYDPRYARATADIARNGAKAKAESIAFMKQTRKNMRDEVLAGDPDKPTRSIVHALQSLADGDRGKMTYAELLGREHGTLQPKPAAKPAAKPKGKAKAKPTNDPIPFKDEGPTRNLAVDFAKTQKPPTPKEERDYTKALDGKPLEKRLDDIAYRDLVRGSSFAQRVAQAWGSNPDSGTAKALADAKRNMSAKIPAARRDVEALRQVLADPTPQQERQLRQTLIAMHRANEGTLGAADFRKLLAQKRFESQQHQSRGQTLLEVKLTQDLVESLQ